MARPILAIPWVIVPVLLITALVAVRFYSRRRRRREAYPRIAIESYPEDDLEQQQRIGVSRHNQVSAMTLTT